MVFDQPGSSFFLFLGIGAGRHRVSLLSDPLFLFLLVISFLVVLVSIFASCCFWFPIESSFYLTFYFSLSLRADFG